MFGGGATVRISERLLQKSYITRYTYLYSYIQTLHGMMQRAIICLALRYLAIIRLIAGIVL